MMILIAGYESSGQIPSVYRRTCLQDSLPALAAPARDQWDRFTSSQTYRMTYVAVPLIAAGLIVAGEDSHFHSLRDNFLPSFRHHYDDYLQYAPAIAMLGLKIGGIQGRSSWGRMLVSDAFSASLMAIAVNTLKHTVKVMRPDGSNRHSFPSGHSATAFMTATMLHKEYGMTRSPWYSIGAYTAATLTGLVGAGIGILSTEVGYYLADLIFKGRGITYARLPDRPFDPGYKPSFFGLYLGLNLTPGRYALEDGREVSLSTGGTAGVEGAWFITRHIGIGGRATISNMPLSVDKILQDESLDMISGYVGPFFSYPLTGRRQTARRICSLSLRSAFGHPDRRQERIRVRNGPVGHVPGQPQIRDEILYRLRSRHLRFRSTRRNPARSHALRRRQHHVLTRSRRTHPAENVRRLNAL